MAYIALRQSGVLDRMRGWRARDAIDLCCTLLSLGVGWIVLGAWLLGPHLGVDGSFLWLMRANTALCAVCVSCGTLLLLDERHDGSGRLRRVLCVPALAICLATLFEHAAGVDLGVDQLLVADPSRFLPGRMSPWTAAVFLLLTTALLSHRTRRLDWMADVALVVACVVLQLISAGYFYGVMNSGVDLLTRMTPQTLVCLGAISVALITGRHGRGVAAIAARTRPGGAAVRLLLPVALLVPLLLGWVRLLAEWQGVMASPPVGVAMFAVTQTLVLAGLIYGVAFRLDAAESQERAEGQEREPLERPVAICAWTGKVRWRGEWVAIEQYLAERWGLQVTHTICEEARRRMEEGLGPSGEDEAPSP